MSELRRGDPYSVKIAEKCLCEKSVAPYELPARSERGGGGAPHERVPFWLVRVRARGARSGRGAVSGGEFLCNVMAVDRLLARPKIGSWVEKSRREEIA